MMTADNFKYLVDWLYGRVKDAYESDRRVKELAEGSYKPLKGVISSLWKMFDRAIFEERDRTLRYAGSCVYAFNGKWFDRVEDPSFVEELVRRVLSRLGTQPVYQLEGAKQMAKPLLNRLKLTAECAYEADRRWICFQNGVLDLKNREFKGKFGMNYCTDIILDFDYNPKASNVLWSAKLKQIVPNEGFRSDFQQFCGSLLADRRLYKNEYVCYLHGGGGNGKSVLASAVASVFGKDYYSTFSLSQIFAKETATLFVVKELSGKLLNWADDVEDRDVATANFKRFISGDSFMGRGLGKGDWSKVTPPMLLCCINTFPDISDDSEGNHRRQLIIETTHKQWQGEERDTQLTAKLASTESRQAIFNWIYEGYKRFVSNNGAIKLSKDSAMARVRRKDTSSPMRRWAMERGFVYAKPVDNSDPRWRKLTDLYLDYREYCISNGDRYEADSRKISAMLRDIGAEVKNLNGRGTSACVGVLGLDTDENGRITSK